MQPSKLGVRPRSDHFPDKSERRAVVNPQTGCEAAGRNTDKGVRRAVVNPQTECGAAGRNTYGGSAFFSDTF